MATRPTYSHDIERLKTAYVNALRDIEHELLRLDLTDFSRAQSTAVLMQIRQILDELGIETGVWCTEIIPEAAKDGVASAIHSLGLTSTLHEARMIARFNEINTRLVETIIADTQADLMAVNDNISRRVRNAIQRSTAEAMRANAAAGITGRRTISRDILQGMKQQLGDSLASAIVDSRGRRWRPETYVDMLARTKLMHAHLEATTNEAIEQGALYGVISSHSAKDACANYEGTIVRLSSEAEGNYPTLDELRGSGRIFHPNCRHVVTPTFDPQRSERRLKRT